MIGRVTVIIWIVVVWLIASESFTVHAAVGAAILGVLLTRLFHPEDRETGRLILRPLAVVRFFIYFLAKLARANVQVALAVIRPARVDHRRAIVSVPITECSETVVWFLANAVSLTPGTSIIDLRRTPPVFYLHVLELDTVLDTRRQVLEMQRRLLLAFGTTDEIRDVETRIAALSAGTAPGREPS